MIQSVVITSHEEQYAPPVQSVLDLSLVEDVVFLDICSYDEDHDSRHLEIDASIGVNLEDLIDALVALGAVERTDRYEADDPS